MSDQRFAMADVSAKSRTRRRALAGGQIVVGAEALGLLEGRALPKGDALAMAEIAGIQGAKRTPELIPLCHPIALNRVGIRTMLRPDQHAVDVYALAEIDERTGVEMEALCGLSIALLTIWDLVKPINPALEIRNIRLLYKEGGKTGTFVNPEGLPDAAREFLEEH